MYELEIIHWGGIVNSVTLRTKEKCGYEKMGQILSKDSQRKCECFVCKRLQAFLLCRWPRNQEWMDLEVTMPYHEEGGK